MVQSTHKSVRSLVQHLIYIVLRDTEENFPREHFL